jgi:hypothetical protein
LRRVSFYALGWEATVTAKGNIDDVLGILVSLEPQVVPLLVVLVLPFVVLIRERCIEILAKVDALEECVFGLRVHRALLVQDLLKLILVLRLLATRVALHSHDFMVELALLGGFRVVPLALVGGVAIVSLVVVVLGEALILLI